MSELILLSEWQKSQVEFWRPIQGFEGYDVSSFGRVRSYWRRGGGRLGYQLRANDNPVLLNCSGHKQGYRTTTLSGKQGRKTFMVHRLVAIAFLDNPNMLPEVNHLTGIKHDNRLDNLEWLSRTDNQRHAVRIGLITGEKIARGFGWMSKILSEKDVLTIRERRAAGETGEKIGQDYKISGAYVSEIVTGCVFAQVGGPRTFQYQFCRLSDGEVRTVRNLVKTKAATQMEIARQFNIDPSDVSRIASRQRYGRVTD